MRAFFIVALVFGIVAALTSKAQSVIHVADLSRDEEKVLPKENLQKFAEEWESTADLFEFFSPVGPSREPENTNTPVTKPPDFGSTSGETKATDFTATNPQTKPTDFTLTNPDTKPTDATPTKPHTKPTDVTPTKPHTKPTKPTPTISTPPPTPSTCGFVPDCPAKGTHLIANPCPESCQKYFICHEGSWSAKTCLPWENFHPNLLSCEWWWNVDCSWLQSTTSSPDLTTFPQYTTPIPISTSTPCVFTPKCPPSGAVKIADPCHCQKFFNCTDGQYQEKACLPWENFDPNKLKCVFLLDVDCNWPHTPPMTSTTTAPATTFTPTPTKPVASTPTSTPATSSAATSPTKQPTTSGTTATLTTQTAAPTTSAPKTSTTPKVDPNECNFKPTCPAVGSERIPIPCEGYCSRYYECTNGKAELKTCPKWLWTSTNFHHLKKECKLAVLVNCNWYKKL